MKELFTYRTMLTLVLLTGLAAALGCDVARGGASVYLEGVSIGSVSMEGKPVTGLPSSKVNVVLKVAANQVRINQSSGKTVIKLMPSGATVVAGADGISFTGVKAEQVELQWPKDESGG